MYFLFRQDEFDTNGIGYLRKIQHYKRKGAFYNKYIIFQKSLI